MSKVLDSVQLDRHWGAWTAKSAGPKPERLEFKSWLVEVVQVIDGTGGSDEGKWWTEVVERRTYTNGGVAEDVARQAAIDWYEDTDQSGGWCLVKFRCTAWNGASWTVEVPLEWELKAAPKSAVAGGGA